MTIHKCLICRLRKYPSRLNSSSQLFVRNCWNQCQVRNHSLNENQCSVLMNSWWPAHHQLSHVKNHPLYWVLFQMFRIWTAWNLKFSCGSNVPSMFLQMFRFSTDWSFHAVPSMFFANVSIFDRLECSSHSGFRICVVWNFHSVESMFLQEFRHRLKNIVCYNYN